METAIGFLLPLFCLPSPSKKLFYIEIPMHCNRTLFSQLYATESMVLSFFIEKNANGGRSDIRNLLACICCNPSYENRGLSSSSDYFPFSYSLTMLAASPSILDDSKFIEFYNHCISLCGMAYRTSQLFPQCNTGLMIKEFDDFKFNNICSNPIGCLLRTITDSKILDKVSKSWELADQIIQKTIEPLISKFTPLNVSPFEEPSSYLALFALPRHQIFVMLYIFRIQLLTLLASKPATAALIVTLHQFNERPFPFAGNQDFLGCYRQR